MKYKDWVLFVYVVSHSVGPGPQDRVTLGSVLYSQAHPPGKCMRVCGHGRPSYNEPIMCACEGLTQRPVIGWRVEPPRFVFRPVESEQAVL